MANIQDMGMSLVGGRGRRRSRSRSRRQRGGDLSSLVSGAVTRVGGMLGKAMPDNLKTGSTPAKGGDEGQTGGRSRRMRGGRSRRRSVRGGRSRRRSFRGGRSRRRSQRGGIFAI